MPTAHELHRHEKHGTISTILKSFVPIDGKQKTLNWTNVTLAPPDGWSSSVSSMPSTSSASSPFSTITSASAHAVDMQELEEKQKHVKLASFDVSNWHHLGHPAYTPLSLLLLPLP
eukprot:CAMPEP_0173064524 /NCGR_PEP_ID=MMETSP1102-20130122/5053_1 /TAXON_ID=49646 /ORGANISM="Geminigera sp., Strain Caron Lab Isolate" /LENGTH=115 /DNA_ID=CAMNT_0013931579 /DNA_START=536 /DNA_END=880 /DNA_ORIENTATION=+